jgi:hypothetical protein
MSFMHLHRASKALYSTTYSLTPRLSRTDELIVILVRNFHMTRKRHAKFRCYAVPF